MLPAGKNNSSGDGKKPKGMLFFQQQGGLFLFYVEYKNKIHKHYFFIYIHPS